MSGSKRPSSRLSSTYTAPYVPQVPQKLEQPVSEPLLSKPLLSTEARPQKEVHQEMMKTIDNVYDEKLDESSKSEPFTEDSLGEKSNRFYQ